MSSNTGNPNSGRPLDAVAARLIALDWGTSSLRAYLFDREGQLIEHRASALGVQKIQQNRFLEALESLCGAWLSEHPQATVIACGMIGSQQGWRDAGYRQCPIGVDELGAELCRADDLLGRPFRIVPGLMMDPQRRADIMRGEETQILGLPADYGQGQAVLVMPGSHCKWVELRDGFVTGFQSYLTGELFEAIAAHTIVGRLFPAIRPEHDEAAFAAGLQAVRSEPQSLTAWLFSVRAQGITGVRPAPALPSYLSGLLIGAELNSALLQFRGVSRVTLIGDAQLCARYEQALELFGITAIQAADELASKGLFRLAARAGLIG